MKKLLFILVVIGISTDLSAGKVELANKQELLKSKILNIIKNGSYSQNYPMGSMPGGMLIGADAETVATYVAGGMKGEQPAAYAVCASCHGVNSKGMNGMSPDLEKYVKFHLMQITGGFGITLGDKFNLSMAASDSTEDGSFIIYNIIPPKKFKYLDKYEVYLTPKSHRIQRIFGRSEYKHFGDCKADLAFIKNMLEMKYYVAEEYTNSLSSVKYQIANNSDEKRILFGCSRVNLIRNDLFISYIDDTLEEIAKQEKAELELKTSADSL